MMSQRDYVLSGAMWSLATAIVFGYAVSITAVSMNCVPVGELKPNLALLAWPEYGLTSGGIIWFILLIIEIVLGKSRIPRHVLLRRTLVAALSIALGIGVAYLLFRANMPENCAL